jgi:hypothetical protein
MMPAYALASALSKTDEKGNKNRQKKPEGKLRFSYDRVASLEKTTKSKPWN